MNADRVHALPGPIEVHRLGLVDYASGLEWQEEAAIRVRAGGPEAIGLLEHEPVYTLGARGDRTHLLTDCTALGARGAQVVETDRGGDVTFHGPGQLVVYPILDLRSRGLLAGDYVRRLEEVAIDTAAAFGVEAARVKGRPGAWVRVDSKLAAVGVRVRGGVATHGLALNVSTDLTWFDAIVPCGLEGTTATSLERELALRNAHHPYVAHPEPVQDPGGERGHESTLRAATEALLEAFARVFEVTLVEQREAIGAV